VCVTDPDYADFDNDPQNEGFEYFKDYVCDASQGDECPFEWECHGVPIGRQTYIGNNFADGCSNGYIGRVGHFTSINGGADIGVNHQLDMVFTSDDIERFFNEENKRRFNGLLDADPKHPYARSKEKITIGSDVYIGANAFINASRVTEIGDGAIIGSGAVVIADVPPYAVVAGVPAKVKRYRFEPDMIEALLRIKWWEWNIDEINANAEALMSPEIFRKKFM
jgi:aminocyclitol acetyltransferase